MEKYIEYRSADIPQIIESEGMPTKISGYAAVFNSLSRDLGGFKEVIKRGAFQNSLGTEQDVLALINHDKNQILARKSSGTLTLKEDKNGLYYEFEIPPTTRGKDLAIDIQRGNIKGSSFGFYIPDGGSSYRIDKESNIVIRDVSQAILVDVSPVTDPAYTAATVSVRGLEEFKRSLEAEEQKPDLTKEIQKRKLKIMESSLNR